MKLVLILILAALVIGCMSKSVPPANTQPVTLFEAHARLCPQCSRPIMNDDGTENSICEEGFRLFQEDIRRAQAAQTTNTGPR